VSSRGVVALDRETYSVTTSALVRVFDSDLNTNPSVPDVTTVAVVSTTEAAAETVTCTETGNRTGIFVGPIPLVSGAPASDGQLQVKHGDTVTATYVDADDGSGGTNVSRTDTAFVDGQAPAFSGLTSAAAGSGVVSLAWSAAADNTPPVRYNIYRAQAPNGQDFGSPLATTHHTTYRDESAEDWRTYYYVVRAEDAVGNEDDNTVERRATPRGLERAYSYSLDSDPGWTCDGAWDFGKPLGAGSFCGDPTSGYSGENVYGYNLWGDYSDMLRPQYLTTPAMDCSDLSVVVLKFWRWLGVEDSMWDEAGIEASVDGETWVPIWEHSGAAVCDQEWVQRSYDISHLAAGRPTVYIRWRMGYTDFTVTYPGWNIDDIEIYGLADIGSAGAVALDQHLYDLAGEPLVSVCDTDLDANPAAPDVIAVEVASTTETAPETVTCTETADSSGVFVGSIPLTTGAPAPDGQLQVSDADTITATYVDAYDGAGGTGVVCTSTAVVDGRGPRFTGVGSAYAGDRYVALAWAKATDDTPPIWYSVYRAGVPEGHDFGSPLALTPETSYRDENLTNGQTYYYVVRAQDGLGNEDDNIVQRMATPNPLESIYSYPLDTDPGWTRQPGWSFGAPIGGGSHCCDPIGARTGTNVFGNNLSGDYLDWMRPVYLVTRPLDCSNLLSVSLRFWRWLGIEDAMWDHVALDVSADGVTWEPAWEHTSTTICDGAWVQCTYDISEIAARESGVWVRWCMGPTDSWITLPGWNIDDVEILGLPATLLFSDVVPAFWAFDYIQACSRAGVAQGYGDGQYYPSLSLSRDQMAVFIARAHAGGDENVPEYPPPATFDDVPTDHWAYKYVEYCVANGIVGGYDPVTYAPTVVVRRDQMSVFICRAWGLPL
jgi:hypothetical protein